MDAFQGCYKTTPRDYRYLSIIPFLLRSSANLLQFMSKTRFFSVFGVVLIGASCAIAISSPFRFKKQNIYNIFVYQALACNFFLMDLSISSVYTAIYTWYIYERICALLFYLPVVGIMLYYVKRFITLLKKTLRRIISWYRSTTAGCPPDDASNAITDERRVFLNQTV